MSTYPTMMGLIDETQYVEHLTESGAMAPALLYSSPHTDFSPRGVEGVFGGPDTAEIVSILRSIAQTAAA